MIDLAKAKEFAENFLKRPLNTMKITQEQYDMADRSNFPNIVLEDGKEYRVISFMGEGATVVKVEDD